MFFEVDIPVVQVDKCQGEAERHVGELLAHTHLQVDRHFVVFLIVGFQLSAQVLGDGRNRPFMIRVVIVIPRSTPIPIDFVAVADIKR